MRFALAHVATTLPLPFSRSPPVNTGQKDYAEFIRIGRVARRLDRRFRAQSSLETQIQRGEERPT